jgi:hypothetical protein
LAQPQSLERARSEHDMSENVIIAICTGIASLVGWTIKVLLRVEKRLTRVETKLGTGETAMWKRK